MFGALTAMAGLDMDEMKKQFDGCVTNFNKMAEDIAVLKITQTEILSLLKAKEIENVGNRSDGSDTPYGSPGNSSGVGAVDFLLGRARDIGYPVD